MAIINSLLDTDLYKFTTSHAYYQLFPHAKGVFRFIDRGGTPYPKGFAEALQAEVDAMASLRLTKSEALFIREQMPYIPPTYVDFLCGYSYDPTEVTISQDSEGYLSIEAEGPLYRVTLWETPILAIVSELYYKMHGVTYDKAYIEENTAKKAQLFKENNITLSLFGMRRRFSYEVEDLVTQIMKEKAGNSLYGTSNVHFAHKHGLKVSGTHPHEWIQFHGAIYGYKMANYMSMENWIRVYDGDLGTVLTDTYTTDIFLRNFSRKHAHLYSSLRHDSGDPFSFIDKVIARYQELRINPQTKYIIFSDGLDPEKAIEIKRACEGRIDCTFGIGTNLTNDTNSGLPPCNIVMKLWQCKMTDKESWIECVKLSDAYGKTTGESEEVELARRTLKI